MGAESSWNHQGVFVVKIMIMIKKKKRAMLTRMPSGNIFGWGMQLLVYSTIYVLGSNNMLTYFFFGKCPSKTRATMAPLLSGSLARVGRKEEEEA